MIKGKNSHNILENSQTYTQILAAINHFNTRLTKDEQSGLKSQKISI